MKILLLGGDFNNAGGTERVGTIVANGLSELGHEVILASIINGLEPFFPVNKEVNNVSLSKASGRVLYSTPKIIYKLRKLLKKEKIEVLIVVETMSVLFTFPAIVGLPIKHVCWEHFNFNSDLGKKGRRVARQLAARYCDSVITLTERDKQYWLSGTKHKEQIISIANPSPFPVQESIKDHNSKIVLAVGRLTYQKGFDLLLQAWLKIIHLSPGWKLKIVGEGEDKDKLEKFIMENKLTNSVELINNTNNIQEYYQEAEIFCLSSRFEGFGMVLIEALSFGLPIVSFDCEVGPAEILADTGSILVPESDVEQFSSSLLELMRNDNNRKNIHIKSKEKAKFYQPSTIMSLWQEELMRVTKY